MKAKFHTTRNHAFVVHQDDLSKIWKLLEDRIGPVYASGECSDDVVRKFDDWKSLASYDNPPMKKILKLSIRSRSDDWQKSADVDFSDNRWLPINIRIEAPEKVGVEIKDKISDVLDGIKPWYSILTGVDFNNFLLFFWFSYLMWHIVFRPSTPAAPNTSEDYIVLGFLVVLMLVLVLVIHLCTQRLTKLWAWLFPVGFFALGQGEQRYKRIENIQWGIGIAFLVSLAASTVGLLW